MRTVPTSVCHVTSSSHYRRYCILIRIFMLMMPVVFHRIFFVILLACMQSLRNFTHTGCPVTTETRLYKFGKCCEQQNTPGQRPAVHRFAAQLDNAQSSVVVAMCFLILRHRLVLTCRNGLQTTQHPCTRSYRSFFCSPTPGQISFRNQPQTVGELVESTSSSSPEFESLICM